jgi:hypothetical protein
LRHEATSLPALDDMRGMRTKGREMSLVREIHQRSAQSWLF